MEEDNEVIYVLVPSDMVGKPIQSALAKTFSGKIVKTVNLSDEVITDYSSKNAEKTFERIVDKLDAFLNDENGYNDKYSNLYVLCGGSVINACIAAVLSSQRRNLLFLVWEKKSKKYEIFTEDGRRVENEGSTEFNYVEREDTGY